MAVVLDTTNVTTRVTNGEPQPPRHPEKAHRPDSPMGRKPDWIRV